jgi:hypothetical protein
MSPDNTDPPFLLEVYEADLFVSVITAPHRKEILEKRARVLRKEDSGKKIRKSH